MAHALNFSAPALRGFKLHTRRPRRDATDSLVAVLATTNVPRLARSLLILSTTRRVRSPFALTLEQTEAFLSNKTIFLLYIPVHNTRAARVVANAAALIFY